MPAPVAGRPTRADLLAARDRTIPDLVRPGLRVLFCGINPGLYSGATGFHFARPGNRFWRALHGAGFTPVVFEPSNQAALLVLGIGITNIVARTTAAASELSAAELAAGGARLRALVIETQPAWLAILGVGAFRLAFDRPDAAMGPQNLRIGSTRTWLLPNPSGLNGHYQLPDLVAAFAALRAALP